MDAKVRELLVISLISLGALCLAWSKGADYFAMAYGATALIAAIEAIRRSR
jgi:hypothetical protein